MVISLNIDIICFFMLYYYICNLSLHGTAVLKLINVLYFLKIFHLCKINLVKKVLFDPS